MLSQMLMGMSVHVCPEFCATLALQAAHGLQSPVVALVVVYLLQLVQPKELHVPVSPDLMSQLLAIAKQANRCRLQLQVHRENEVSKLKPQKSEVSLSFRISSQVFTILPCFRKNWSVGMWGYGSQNYFKRHWIL